MAPRLKNLKVPKRRGGNLDEEITRITTFTRNYVNEAGARGVVIGMSGGVDSAVVSFLSVKALGAKRVTALLLFEDEFKKGKDYKDAERLISKIKIERVEFDITRVIDAFQNAFLNWGFKTSKVSLANVKARVRMTLLYLVANERKLLVIGTGDRSEESIGYFTKYGDGGVDFMPIAHLYKTEVKALARKLGVPRNIIEKPSSPNLWKGHT
ncbi:MAG: NAD(+) synthase, partial [Nitrososphaerales archaeon]